ncbi:TM2 domain-containing protein almondex isoform X1 [Photinus pyralis]|uniref:TM2 domain-containing protein almondex isoform X1 n=1 Tax=Photinus pyralis TaxID=7054 RepID=UPI0012675CB0|nr:TM2 domain-containing protein almondex isoform X1 [Photinus pyralis]
MKYCRINIPKALFLIISVFLNNINITLMAADNNMEKESKQPAVKNLSNSEVSYAPKHYFPDTLHCESDRECHSLNPPCIYCNLNPNCIYGEEVNVSCNVNQLVQCKGEHNFQRSFQCRYCYQTELWEHACELKANCNSAATPPAYYRSNCTVNDDVLCLGHRTFFKNIRCNWTGGRRWSSALILSVVLGGFGADRFYLGHWQEGIGKLFSFGGLGVWTIVDVILISLHYLGPADGSLYI